jgi:hypothetical protein
MHRNDRPSLRGQWPLFENPLAENRAAIKMTGSCSLILWPSMAEKRGTQRADADRVYATRSNAGPGAKVCGSDQGTFQPQPVS